MIWYAFAFTHSQARYEQMAPCIQRNEAMAHYKSNSSKGSKSRMKSSGYPQPRYKSGGKGLSPRVDAGKPQVSTTPMSELGRSFSWKTMGKSKKY